ncbi:Bestrophin/UPF0187 [Phytophthora cactorum]|nr:Bestrophin/UPF0187 [Phytophthora cactorum]
MAALAASSLNGVKIYNLSSGKTLPQWLAEKGGSRKALAKDEDYRRRVELLQDFHFPAGSQRVFDVRDLSLKFERGLDAEVVQLEVLSADFGKLAFLQADRSVAFHAPYGTHYNMRIPKFGRDMTYHRENCELYVAASGSDVYRINLDQGRFVAPLELQSQSSAANVVQLNPIHQLLGVGCDDGVVEMFDSRSQQRVGSLDIAAHCATNSAKQLEVTALRFDDDGLTFGVGTSEGQCLLYDLRSSRPLLEKNHQYGLPIVNLQFHDYARKVISSDAKVIKIWDRVTVPCSRTWKRLRRSRITGNRSKVVFVLDSLTEELEEEAQATVYDDYRFVTRAEIASFGLDHLVGTPLLKAYMHGFFMDARLYNKVKAVAEPFAYDEWRKKKLKEKVEAKQSNRITIQRRLPKINRATAERILQNDAKQKKHSKEGDEEAEADKTFSNPLGDDRFSRMFTSSDFEVDEESDTYRMLHPNAANIKQQRKQQEDMDSDAGTDDDEEDEVGGRFARVDDSEEEEIEGRPSDESSDEEEEEEIQEPKRFAPKGKRKPAPNSTRSQKARSAFKKEETVGGGYIREMSFVPQAICVNNSVHASGKPMAQMMAMRHSAMCMLPDAEKPKWSSSQWRLHEYDPNRAYTWPEKEDLYDSGLSEKEGETLLSHCFPRAIQVLLEEVCDNGHLGWILGPSGRGKSNTALAFALSVDRSKWVVTWIHVWEKMDWFSCTEDDERRHLVIVDGLTNTTNIQLETIWIKPRLWGQGSYDAIMVSKGEHCVRLVQVTSAKDHDFKVDYCYDWMKEALEASAESFEVKKSEIFIVVAFSELPDFKISGVVDSGLRCWNSRSGMVAMGALSEAARDIVSSGCAYPISRDILEKCTFFTELRRLVFLYIAIVFHDCRGRDDIDKLKDLGVLTNAEYDELFASGSEHKKEEDEIESYCDLVRRTPHKLRATITELWLKRLVQVAAQCGHLTPGNASTLQGKISQLPNLYTTVFHIANVPIPFNYMQYLQFLLAAYMLLYMFVIVPNSGLYTPIWVFLWGTFLFMADEIALEIECPFGLDANDIDLEERLLQIEEELTVLVRSQYYFITGGSSLCFTNGLWCQMPNAATESKPEITKSFSFHQGRLSPSNIATVEKHMLPEINEFTALIKDSARLKKAAKSRSSGSGGYGSMASVS